MATVLDQERLIIARAKRGDRASSETLLRAYLPIIEAYLRRVVGPGDHADLRQTVALEMLRSLPRFRGSSKLSTWLYSLTMRVAIRQSQRERKHSGVELSETAAADSTATQPDTVVAARSRLNQVQAVLENLKPEQRAAYVAFELDGQPLDEIADAMGSSVPTTAARVRAARTRILHLLTRERAELDRIERTTS